MAEGLDHSDVGEVFDSPVLQMRRGMWSPWRRGGRAAVGCGLVSEEVGFSPSVVDSGRGTGFSYNPGGSPVGQFMEGGPLTSSPNSIDAAVISHLIDMVGQLGAQIAKSIVAKLVSAGAVNINSGHQNTIPLIISTSDTNTDSHTVT